MSVAKKIVGLCAETLLPSTTDYDRFVFLKRNRKVDRFPNLKRSLHEYGQIMPILINEKWEVLEGQHRVEECRDLGIPVKYICVPGLTYEVIVPINNVRKNWKLRDYPNLFCNIEDYREFQRYMEKYGFVANTLSGIAFGQELNAKAFKAGDLKFDEPTRRYVDKVVPAVLDILGVCGGEYRGRLGTGRVVAAVVNLTTTPGYNHRRFIKKLASVPKWEVKAVKTYADAKNMLEGIYNQGLPSRKKLYIRPRAQ
jgi:hypothetical protein